MKTLLAAFALSIASILNAEPMEKDAAHIVLTQSEIENATRWDEIRRWTTEASARGAKTLIVEINVTQGGAQRNWRG
jgi:membrane-bound ClpP family serine protease